MAFLAIDHICLDVADMERAKAFFIGQLDFAETAPEHVAGGIRTAFLRGGGVVVDLKAPVDDAVAPRPTGTAFTPGVNHVALKADDIHATYAALVAKGVAFSQGPRYMAHSDRTIAIFHDPDGNCFHLTS